MSSKNIAHGKVSYGWCDRCGTLILGRTCSFCEVPARDFEVNSPGDIRPCMGDAYDTVIDLFEKAFGTSEPLKDRMIFFNKVPGEDRTDEIVAHGEVIGILRFDVKENRLKIDLRQAGADLFLGTASKNIVMFGGMSGHLKGKVIEGKNISEIRGEFFEGDTVIVVKGSKAGPGTALSDSSNLNDSARAVKIKDLDPRARVISPPSGREEFVRSNKKHLTALEASSVSDVRSFVKGKKQPVSVSFSGGKDSLAAFGIASKAADVKDVLFIDTGLEFPETLEYVERFVRFNDLNLHKAEGGNAFWNNVGTFGPPAKDFRWCCKVCKLGPISDLIGSEFPHGTITIEGNRMMESFSRSEIGFVSKNPFVPGQTNLNPVRTWSSAEIWGYIWMRKLDYNPLYERDFERIGCYLCPSCLASEWRNTERIHPELYSKWEDHLREYAKERNLPKEYADMGFWRWKVLPPKMVLLADEIGINVKTGTKKGLTVEMLKGASSCAAGGYSVEAIADIPRNRDFSYVEDALKTIGEVRYSPEFEIAMLKAPKGKAKLFGGGQVSVTSDTLKGAEEVFEKAVKALIRAEMCTECGICSKSCPKRAIKISGGMRVDGNKCNRCGKCERSCMVVHYYDKISEKKHPSRNEMNRTMNKR